MVLGQVHSALILERGVGSSILVLGRVVRYYTDPRERTGKQHIDPKHGTEIYSEPRQENVSPYINNFIYFYGYYVSINDNFSHTLICHSMSIKIS